MYFLIRFERGEVGFRWCICVENFLRTICHASFQWTGAVARFS